MMLRSKFQPRSGFRTLFRLSAFALLLLPAILLRAQEDDKRGRKYQAPPDTSTVTVLVLKDANSKAIENAAVVFHMIGQEGKGNMEMKTNEEGKARIEVIPIGYTVRLQVIADGYQTFGEDYKIDTDSKDITVRLKRPGRQYSTYEHPAASATPPSDPKKDPKQNSTTAPPKQ